jgi:hypothetical protein
MSVHELTHAVAPTALSLGQVEIHDIPLRPLSIMANRAATKIVQLEKNNRDRGQSVNLKVQRRLLEKCQEKRGMTASRWPTLERHTLSV